MEVRLSQDATNRINELAKKNGGTITPDMVLEDALRTASPLHRYFEWDVNKAAHRHWIETARAIIRSVKVEITTHHRVVNVSGYVRDASSDREQGYRRIADVQRDGESAERVYDYEVGRAESALRRVLDIADTLDRGEAARDALRAVLRLKRKSAAA